ncbi:hypothetical protein NECAME_07938 [Necator americanus]|uniref:Uncharacterized protein n=1 Tax=Necator americanus TaxID=51031 RepID=W2TL23_NECAM|nr:hypothetical protein NECAME_07938 [Necator americanus]ETN82493.1 hypothetical protein NECAME_07938 [Necator americanus]
MFEITSLPHHRTDSRDTPKSDFLYSAAATVKLSIFDLSQQKFAVTVLSLLPRVWIRRNHRITKTKTSTCQCPKQKPVKSKKKIEEKQSEKK